MINIALMKFKFMEIYWIIHKNISKQVRELVNLPFYVYILVCSDGTFYTGYTKNVEERLRLHICGKGARYTKAHKPERVVYVEPTASRAEAMKRERIIKKLPHQKKVFLIESASSDKKA